MARLHGFCGTTSGSDLSVIDAKNDNARSGRQNAMCNKTNAAANTVAAEDFPDAVDQLNSLREKLDGDPSVKDWMVDGDEKSNLAIKVELMTELLEIQ